MLFLSDICLIYQQLVKDVESTCALFGPEFAPYTTYLPNQIFKSLCAPLKPEHLWWHKDVPQYGLNAGVMMINLNRMRELDWTNLFIRMIESEPWSQDVNLLNYPEQNILNIMGRISPHYVSSFSFANNDIVNVNYWISMKHRLDEIMIVHGSSHVFQYGAVPFSTEIWWRFMPNLKPELNQYGNNHRPAALHNYTDDVRKCYLERTQIHDVIRSIQNLKS